RCFARHFDTAAASVLTRRRGASAGDLVTMLMVAKIPLLPQRADEGPRTISMRLTRSMSRPKSCPKKFVRAVYVFGQRVAVEHHQKARVMVARQREAAQPGVVIAAIIGLCRVATSTTGRFSNNTDSGAAAPDAPGGTGSRACTSIASETRTTVWTMHESLA